jgi:molybdopterin/thiamine biosynthesis adenylyltransferase
MPGKFHHEQLYRGQDVLAKLGELRLTLCGAGALGSNLADSVARQGVRHLRVIDHDRIEEHNVSTQLYGESEVGGWKVEVLRNRLFRACGIEVAAVRKQFTQDNASQLVKESGLIIDTFDSSLSRSLVQGACRASGTSCLHVGLFEDYGEVIWDEHYRVPSDVAGDVCDYPLARNLVLMTVAIASEAVVRFAREGSRRSYSVTLNDFAVRELGTT